MFLYRQVFLRLSEEDTEDLLTKLKKMTRRFKGKLMHEIQNGKGSLDKLGRAGEGSYLIHITGMNPNSCT